MTATGAGIVAARFEAPADVYPHRIMGDIPERLVLAVRDAGGRERRIDLRETGTGRNVFEDIAPRIVDADGDGHNDAVVVETDPRAGASLAIYGLRGGSLVRTAATPHVGRPFRWLAPVGIGDLDGNGIVDLAYVEAPHVGHMLKIWSRAPGGLTEIARASGFSNHRIGDTFISGGLRDCGTGPEMVTADAGWTRVLASRLTAAGIVTRDLGPLRGPADLEAALACAL